MAQMETIVGIAAGILTGVSMLPQLIKIIREKKATAISLPVLVILLSGLGLWVWYGVLKKDIPIIATNGFSMVVNMLIIGTSQFYKNKE
ncbi:MAG TPA: SemiSWEET transporter [Flavipsychrobacter sp.]|nr:SemiSWEET transporter [Flavipsychrobacter sp.]